MGTVLVQPPYPAFADIDGQPLEDGYIWIGVAGLQPIGNPINVYLNAAQTISATLPIRTLAGYPVSAGTPVRLYVAANYSIQVQNKNGTVVYTSLQDNLYSGGDGSITSNATGTGSQTVFAVTFVPSAIYINGVYQNQNTYSVSSGNVTFTQAPPLNAVIEFVV